MRPANVLGVANRSQMPRPPFGHNVIRLAWHLHRRLRTILSNKEPILKPKWREIFQ